MKAITRSQYGSSSVLQLEEIANPEPGENDVVVKVAAASVNPFDWHTMRGEPYLIRLTDGLGHPKQAGLGIDVAGTVTDVGSQVTGLKVGDHVFGQGRGTLAEYAVATATRLAVKPPALSFEMAAAIPCAGITALQALRDKGGVKKGDAVLINGASGGVGTFAVQLARTWGATVTGVCSTRNVELVSSLGAAHVVDYTRDDFSRHGGPYDVVMDTVGNRTLRALRRPLAPRGTFVAAGGSKGKWFRPMALFLKVTVVSPVVRQQLRGVMANIQTSDLDVLAGLAVAGDVVPVIDRTYSLADSATAIAYVEEGHARGKVVVTL